MKIFESENYINNPLVSIIIPSYNRIDTVSETLDSILNQKCEFDFEIVIGDDCSDDNVRELLLKYKDDNPTIIKLIFHDNNIGLGANWATCVKYCKGKYICNCDNDDYWHNHQKLQIQVDFMESNPEKNVVFTDHRCHNRKTGAIVEDKAFFDRSIPLQQAFFTGKTILCNATVMYRKSIIEKYIILDDYINYNFLLQDWNTWVILSAYTDFDIIPISTATFGVESISITRPKTVKNLIERFKKEKEDYKYICNLFPGKLTFDEIAYDNYVNERLLNSAYINFDFRSGKKFATLISNESKNTRKVKFALNPLYFFTFATFKRLYEIFHPEDI